MVNDNLEKVLSKYHGYASQDEMGEIKAAIEKDEEDERAAQQRVFYNSLPDNCVTGNKNSCIEPIRTCKHCIL